MRAKARTLRQVTTTWYTDTWLQVNLVEGFEVINVRRTITTTVAVRMTEAKKVVIERSAHLSARINLSANQRSQHLMLRVAANYLLNTCLAGLCVAASLASMLAVTLVNVITCHIWPQICTTRAHCWIAAVLRNTSQLCKRDVHNPLTRTGRYSMRIASFRPSVRRWHQAFALSDPKSWSKRSWMGKHNSSFCR